MQNKTICAISTAPGVGGIAVIRVSGSSAYDVVSEITKKDLSAVQGYTNAFARIYDGNELLDEVILAFFRAPNSFTGEDVVEISCHGSTFIQRRILEILCSKGCVLAQPGEFTMRSYFNGKMDLAQSEAVADLIASESAAAHKQAVHQLRGGLSEEMSKMRQSLMDFAALIELELDFAEEDVEFADRTALLQKVKEVLSYTKKLINSFQQGNAIKNGIPIAIVGRPNAGKSTLLNAILNEERAIVSDIKGTTRDSIEERFTYKGYSFRLIDTAGIRKSEDKIEVEGIRRSFLHAEKASVVIYLIDPSETKKEEVEADLKELRLKNVNVLVVSNKSDLKPFSDAHISISAKHKKGIDDLLYNIYEVAVEKLDSGVDTVLTNTRHVEALTNAQLDLLAAKSGLENNKKSDLVAMDIRSALFHIGSITGEVTTDDLLGNIFSKFCIGK